MKRNSISEAIDLAIEKLPKPPMTFPLRPSSAGHCGRKLAYETTEFLGKGSFGRDRLQPHVHRLLDLGKHVETSSLDMLSLVPDLEIKYKQQVVSLFKLHNGPIVEGSVDAVVFFKELKAVVDVKSTKDSFSKGFRSRFDETLSKYEGMSSLNKFAPGSFFALSLKSLVEELGDDFLVDNLLQVNAYCVSSFMVSRGVDTGIVYKYNKNDSRHYEIQFTPDKDLLVAWEEKCNKIWDAASSANPEAVKKDFTLGSIRCAFCPYQKACWGEDAMKAFFNTYPKKEKPVEYETLSTDLKIKFEEFDSIVTKEKRKITLELEIIKSLQEQGIDKVKLDNSTIYEVRFYKSPKPHFALGKTK